MSFFEYIMYRLCFIYGRIWNGLSLEGAIGQHNVLDIYIYSFLFKCANELTGIDLIEKS